MARVPIVRIGDTLIATVQDVIHDHEALDFQAELSAALERTGARGVLIDLSIVDTVDSFLGRLIHDIARATRLLGAHTVVVGIQPAVAVTLVELGLDLKDVRTALTADRGLALLRSLLDPEARIGRSRGD